MARYVLEHPHEVANMSAAQLARAAGASEATVFRLCRSLGFSGYTDLRDQVSAAVERYAPGYIASVSLHDRDGQQAGGSGLGPMTAAAYNGIRVLLDATAVSDEDIERVADVIASSRRLILTGVGGYTARIAEMAAFGLQRAGVTCMLWLDGQLDHVTQEMFTPGDVVLGISYSGNNKPVTRVLEVANRASAFTVALTNYRFSPVAKQSRIALVTSFREARIQNFDLLPRLSQLLVIDALERAVARRVRSKQGKETVYQRS